MKWFYVAAVAVLICLHVVSVASDCHKLDVQINKALKRAKKTYDYFIKPSQDSVVTFGVKTSPDGTYYRVFTNLVDANGTLSIGTPLTNTEVIDDLNNNQVFKGTVLLYGKNYTAEYRPITHKNGVVFAFIAAAIPGDCSN